MVNGARFFCHECDFSAATLSSEEGKKCFQQLGFFHVNAVNVCHLQWLNSWLESRRNIVFQHSE
jgi:hypothetical protein